MADKLNEIKILVTDRPENPEDKSILRTPSGEANVEVVTMSIYSQVGVRVLRTFLQGWLGFILTLASPAGEAVGIKLPAMDFVGVLLTSASLAVAPAVIGAIQNAVELLTQLDTNSPKLRA